MKEKVCTRCKILKSLDSFATVCRLDKHGQPYVLTQCKECIREKKREEWPTKGKARYRRFHDKNPGAGTEWSRKSRLKAAYGIDISRYEQMFEEQGGCCALCGAHQDTLSRRLNVDHDHASQIVRRLLCGGCNTALGSFRDDPALLRQAAAYIERYRE